MVRILQLICGVAGSYIATLFFVLQIVASIRLVGSFSSKGLQVRASRDLILKKKAGYYITFLDPYYPKRNYGAKLT